MKKKSKLKLKEKILINNRGFTLIEFLIVISIIGILATVGLMSYRGIKIEVDNNVDVCNVYQLNNTTGAYASEYGIDDGDVFLGYSTDLERMERLVETGFLPTSIEQANPSNEFIWSVEEQKWQLLTEE